MEDVISIKNKLLSDNKKREVSR
jgi:hypothetical protein